MERLYIINPHTFAGGILNTMPFVDKGVKNGVDNLNSTYTHYDGGTFAEYNAAHGGQLVALTWEEFSRAYYIPYLTSLQGEWKEITEEQWWDALECLPPMRWTREKGRQFFFISEAYTADIHSCYVQVGDKYYTALRSINAPTSKLFSLAPPTDDVSERGVGW